MQLNFARAGSQKIGFIFSTEVGLKTQYQNWRDNVARLPLNSEWIVIDWYQEGGWIERLPLLPQGLKARLRCQQQLQQGLRKGPFDYLFIGSPAAAYSSRSRLGKTPYFLTLDATQSLLYGFGDHYGKRPSSFSWLETLKENQRKRFFQEARAIFPWSNWVAQSLIQDYGVARERLHVVPPGVDLTRWPMPHRTFDETVHLLFVGGDFYRKGGDLLLAWALSTRKKNWHLHLVTREPLTVSHAQISVHNGLSSNDPALIALYHQAHAFVLPTRADCYSLAGIEAMASGLPTLLGEVGGTSEIIRHGETGYLLTPGSQDELTDHLEYLLSHPEKLEPMGQAARHDAEARYDVKKNIQKVLAIIDQTLPGSGLQAQAPQDTIAA